MSDTKYRLELRNLKPTSSEFLEELEKSTLIPIYRGEHVAKPSRERIKEVLEMDDELTSISDFLVERSDNKMFYGKWIVEK